MEAATKGVTGATRGREGPVLAKAGYGVRSRDEQAGVFVRFPPKGKLSAVPGSGCWVLGAGEQNEWRGAGPTNGADERVEAPGPTTARVIAGGSLRGRAVVGVKPNLGAGAGR